MRQEHDFPHFPHFPIALIISTVIATVVFSVFGIPGWVADGGDGISRFFTAGKISFGEKFYPESRFMTGLLESTSFWRIPILWVVVCIISLAFCVFYLLGLVILVASIIGIILGFKLAIPKTILLLKPKPMVCQR